MAVDLRQELELAAQRVDNTALRWLQSRGADTKAIADMGRTFPPFGIANVELSPGAYFQSIEKPAGVGAIIQPVIEDGEIVDLIAWRSLRPDDWRWRRGTGWALGVDNLKNTGGWDGCKSIRLFSTPLEWLCAGGIGSCILNWDAPEIRHFDGFDTIECTEARVAQKLRPILSKPIHIPEIKVERSSVRAA